MSARASSTFVSTHLRHRNHPRVTRRKRRATKPLAGQNTGSTPCGPRASKRRYITQGGALWHARGTTACCGEGGPVGGAAQLERREAPGRARRQFPLPVEPRRRRRVARQFQHDVVRRYERELPQLVGESAHPGVHLAPVPAVAPRCNVRSHVPTKRYFLSEGLVVPNTT